MDKYVFTSGNISWATQFWFTCGNDDLRGTVFHDTGQLAAPMNDCLRYEQNTDTGISGYIWGRSGRCSCLVTWFCYHLVAKPGKKTAAPSWPDPYPIWTGPLFNKKTLLYWYGDSHYRSVMVVGLSKVYIGDFIYPSDAVCSVKTDPGLLLLISPYNEASTRHWKQWS